jgi:Fe-S oxidoreductase
MLEGNVLNREWQSEAVKDALDLCLSCKACKSECPVNVDMATYKAEFLAHYYQGKLRPRYAYAFGWIHIWSRLASVAPMLVNVFTQTPGLRTVAKFMAGMDQRRKYIPAFAPQSFKSWFASHKPKNPNGPPVVLFADTFNNYYLPQTCKAALEVLEDAGFNVIVPMQDVCCGRPLYDYGFLGMARRWAEDLLDKLRPYVQASIPMVVLEPSCWAVFKDELTNILPAQQEDAVRLQKNTFTFADFLEKKAPHYRVPRLHRKALVQGHCHQKSLDELYDKEYGMLYSEKKVFRQMGVDLEVPDTGCCGMAGAFGYEEGDHYDVSIKEGERVLLPKVRQQPDQAIIIADGFSCREQIHQETDRHALHTAEVIQLALRHGPPGPDGRPEAQMEAERRAEYRHAAMRTAGYVALGAAASAALIWAAKRARESSDRPELGAVARGRL